MPKNVTRMAKSGESESYAVKDAGARELISAETSAREEAVSAEATARGAAVSAEATARQEAVNIEKAIRKGNVDVANGIIFSQLERKFETLSSFTKTEGKGWVDNGQSLLTNANWNAYEITGVDDKKEYAVYGLNIGSQESYRIYMLDENGDTITSYNIDDITEIGSYHFVFAPVSGTKTIRYTTYKNATWDKAPEIVSGYVYNQLDSIKENNANNSKHDMKFVQGNILNPFYESRFSPIENYSKTEGKGWVNNGQGLYPNANWNAYEITDVDDEKEYAIYGVSIGSQEAYKVYLLDEDGNTIMGLLKKDMEEVGNQHYIVFPVAGTKTIRYTTYKNATWDRQPETVYYIEKQDVVIPPYYNENNYFSGKIEEIRAATKITNGVAFVFITDLHMTYNQKNSPLLIKNILDQTTIPFVICGGDITPAFGTMLSLEEYSGNEFVKWQNYIGKDRFFTVRGNHDFTIKTNQNMETMAPDTGITLPIRYTYDYMFRNQERFLHCSAPENMAWYIDIPNQKTRIVGINSCDGQTSDETASWGVYEKISQDQIDWILNNALTEEEYKYIFISHISSDAALQVDITGQAVIQAIAEALKNHTVLNYSDGTVTAAKDFSEFTGTLVCHICGHAHHDASAKSNNVLSIITTCDATYQDDGHGAQAGTITEHAFDVFCIDYDAGTVKAIRVGRGYNREWEY